MIRSTSRPAICPASLVAWRCASSKYAGTVITACVTVSPRNASASRFSLTQDLGADLLRPPSLAVDVDGPSLVAHVTLHRPDRPVGVRDRLALGDLAHQDLAVLREADHGGGRPRPFRVRDHDRLAGLQHGHDRVRRAQVDTDRSCHLWFLLLPAADRRLGYPSRSRCVAALSTRIKVECDIDNFCRSGQPISLRCKPSHRLTRSTCCSRNVVGTSPAVLVAERKNRAVRVKHPRPSSDEGTSTEGLGRKERTCESVLRTCLNARRQ